MIRELFLATSDAEYMEARFRIHHNNVDVLRKPQSLIKRICLPSGRALLSLSFCMKRRQRSLIFPSALSSPYRRTADKWYRYEAVSPACQDRHLQPVLKPGSIASTFFFQRRRKQELPEVSTKTLIASSSAGFFIARRISVSIEDEKQAPVTVLNSEPHLFDAGHHRHKKRGKQAECSSSGGR